MHLYRVPFWYICWYKQFDNFDAINVELLSVSRTSKEKRTNFRVNLSRPLLHGLPHANDNTKEVN